jgi:hypothetical protein
MSPMKSSKTMNKNELGEKQTPRQSIKGSEIPPGWLTALAETLMGTVKTIVTVEMEKAKQNTEENKKVEVEKTEEENNERDNENKEQGN